MSLKKDAIWTGLDTFISSGLSFLFRLVVAKVLAPDQFGVVAMALTVYSMLQVVGDFGLTASLIQRHESRFDDTIVSTTFAMSGAVSLVLFALTLFGVAPVVALFFSSFDVGEMVGVLAFCFLMTPFSSVSIALLYRSRRFRDLAMIRAVAMLAGVFGAAVFLFFFRSPWTIVVQIVLTQLLMTIGVLGRADWRPSLRWDKQTMRSIIGFSGLVSLNDVANALAKNLDIAVIGRLLTKADVGVYSLAFFLTDTVRFNLMSILNRVMFVRYSQDQNDMAALRGNYLNTMRWNCLILFPLMVVTILFGPAVVLRIYGPSWSTIGPVLQLLALGVMFHAAGGTSSTLYKAIGRPGLDLSMFLGTTAAFLVPLVIAGGLLGGMVGVAAGVALAKLLTVLTRQVVLDRLIGSTFSKVMRNAAVATLMQAPLVAVWLLERWLAPTSTLLRDFGVPVIALMAYAALFVPMFKPWQQLRLRAVAK